MIKMGIAGVCGSLIFGLAAVYAADSSEKITLVTYYPTPTAVYQTLRLSPSANPGDCSGGTPPLGKMYYNSTQNSMYICTSNAGTVGYQQVPGGNGSWAINGNSLYVLNTGLSVGIGTTTPGAKLEVAGQIKITGGSPGTGKALVSDSVGLASWQAIINTTFFAYTGSDQSFTVPANVTNITAELWGASGGGGTVGGWSYGASGGGGGYTKGTIPTAPGESLTVIVGQMGYKNQATGYGYGGGASGCNGADNQYGGGGGGYSAIKRGAVTLLVAGGGGGGGSSRAWKDNVGGGGGGFSGTNGQSPYDDKFIYGGGGGTQLSGGPAASGGSSGTQWQGSHAATNCYGGGGGGGFWGGAGGGYSESNTMAGGGGGSGYISPTGVTNGFTVAGAAGSGGGPSENGANGVVRISY